MRRMWPILLCLSIASAAAGQELPTSPDGPSSPAQPETVTRDNGGFVVSVDLPFTDKQQINLSRHADELVIDLGTWRRTLVLPRILVDAPTEGARFDDGTLKIRFGTPAR